MSSQRSKQKHQPVMYVFAGNNGSGKSTLRDLFMNELGLGSIIDPDAIAREIDPDHPEQVSLVPEEKRLYVSTIIFSKVMYSR